MKVFVINLARRPDRLAAITQDFKDHGISFERIDAIDAKTNPLLKKFRRPFFKFLLGKRAYSDGPIANYLSFCKIWQKMVDENIPSALVLEDDAQISNWDPAFLKLDIADFGLDLLRLGANKEPTCQETSTPHQTPKIILGRKLVTGQVWGNVATITTLAAAKKFLRHKKYWFPSDDFQSFEKCFGIKYAIISPLIWLNSESASDIELVKGKLWTVQLLLLKIIKPLRRRLLFPAIHAYLRFKTSLR